MNKENTAEYQTNICKRLMNYKGIHEVTAMSCNKQSSRDNKRHRIHKVRDTTSKVHITSRGHITSSVHRSFQKHIYSRRNTKYMGHPNSKRQGRSRDTQAQWIKTSSTGHTINKGYIRSTRQPSFSGTYKRQGTHKLQGTQKLLGTNKLQGTSK